MPLPVLLSKGSLFIKILPHIGATIVSLEKGGSGNLFKSDSSLWDDKDIPALNAYSDFKAYNGHTIWVGPQSEWWTKQNINTDRRDSAAPWPPDPYMAYGEYTTLRSDKNCISLESPESPISGINVTKEIAINDDETVYLNTAFTNIIDKPISWDIWYNTRIDGYSKVFVPVTSDKDIRVVPVLNAISQEMPYEIKDGFFSYKACVPEVAFKERRSKTYIYPNRPWIAAFIGNNLLVIRFEHHDRKSIHPEQALVEIFNLTEHNSADALLEMEYHSSYKTIKPGEIMNAWEVWKVYENTDTKTDEAKIAYLNDLIKKGDL
jgi:hypothetical protein